MTELQRHHLALGPAAFIKCLAKLSERPSFFLFMNKLVISVPTRSGKHLEETPFIVINVPDVILRQSGFRLLCPPFFDSHLKSMNKIHYVPVGVRGLSFRTVV